MSRQLSQKSFIISSFLILLVGLGFIAGLYFLVNPIAGQTNWLSNGPVTTDPISFNLEIATPDDNILSFDKSTIISGQTSALATVIISGIDQDSEVTADKNGDFSRVVNLDEGPNSFKITAYDDQGNFKTVIRNIYYSTEALP